MTTIKTVIFPLAGMLAALSLSAPAAILLNEIHLRTPGSTDLIPNDRNYEFVELRSTTGGVEACTNLYILMLDNDGSNVGAIKQVWTLKDASDAWLQTGANGLLLLGDDYHQPGSPWASVKSPQTVLADPKGMGPDEMPDVDAVSFLLVSGYTSPAPNAGADVDVDLDNDTLPDWADPSPPAGGLTAAPWSAIVDSIGFNGDQGTNIRPAYSLVTLSTGNLAKGVPSVLVPADTFFPHSMARNAANNTPNERNAWYGGQVQGNAADADSVIYSPNDYFNLLPGQTFRGQVTPGQPNFSSAPVAPVFRINEINANPAGSPGRAPDPDNPATPLANDGNFEFIEIINTQANQAGGNNFTGSLAGYTLLVVDSGGGAGIGSVREAYHLSRLATGSNGLLVLGDGYTTGDAPFAAHFDATTQLADPGALAPAGGNPAGYSGMGPGELPNNGASYLLVQNWSAEPGVDVDDNDDGILDAGPPWSAIVDSVSIPEVDTGSNLVANHGGYSAARPDIVIGTVHYNADNLSRLSGNTAASVTTAWSAGTYGSTDPHALGYHNGIHRTGSGTAFRSAATPGRMNHNSTSPPVPGAFLLNEVSINPPTAVDSTEFVEVISTVPHALMTNLWILVIDARPGADSGLVRRVLDLRGQTAGANRLALFTDGADTGTSALAPYLSGRTTRDDPASWNANGTQNTAAGFNFAPDSLPNEGVSILLVSYTPPTATGLPAQPNADLDTNNDGLLDAAPAWTVLDGFSTGNGVGGVPVAGNGAAATTHLSRYPGNTSAQSASAWYGGALTGGTAVSFGYGASFFGTFKGVASPGRHNATASPPAGVAGLRLNEININPPGGDNDKEFFELVSTDGTALSATGHSILLLDNDGPDTGRVLEVFDLDSAATGTNGLLLAGVGYDTALPWTGPSAPHAATRLFAPDGMAFDDIGQSTGNGALTVLLVRHFTGRAGDDLDQGTQSDLTVADDHILNTPLPWAALADSVAMKGFGPDLLTPGQYILSGFIFPGTADLTVPIPAVPANGYTPDTVARLPGNLTAHSAPAWHGANIAGTAGTSTVYDPVQFFPSTAPNGKVTPGRANPGPILDSADPDRDGIDHLTECALGLDDNFSSTHQLPHMVRAVINSRLQPVLLVVRPTGGVAGMNYIPEASFDLINWNVPMAAAPTTQPNTPSAGWETLSYVLSTTALNQLDTECHIFLRLRIARQ